ncbi:hypothetical protein Tco_0219966 [Tanacetum coccineum]
MTTVDQGISVEEIKRVIPERVANAIEAIAIYETKTNMARKSISQTEQQEFKVAENKRKLNNTSKNNQNQQQPNKRQNTSKDYAAGHGEKKILRRGTTGGIAQSERTKVIKTKLEVLEHMEWCIP